MSTINDKFIKYLDARINYLKMENSESEIGFYKSVKHILSISDERYLAEGGILYPYDAITKLLSESGLNIEEQFEVLLFIIKRNIVPICKMGIFAIDYQKLKSYNFKYSTKDEVLAVLYSHNRNELLDEDYPGISIEEKKKRQEIKEFMENCGSDNTREAEIHKVIQECFFAKYPNLNERDIELFIDALMKCGVEDLLLTEVSQLLVSRIHKVPYQEDILVRFINNLKSYCTQKEELAYAKHRKECISKSKDSIRRRYAEKVTASSLPKESIGFTNEDVLKSVDLTLDLDDYENLDNLSPISKDTRAGNDFMYLIILSEIYSFLFYPASANKSRTFLEDFSFLTSEVIGFSKAKDELELIAAIVKLNIKNGILNHNINLATEEKKGRDEKLPFSDVFEIDKERVFPHEVASLYRNSFMKDKLPEDEIVPLIFEISQKKFNDLVNAHRYIKDHYIDKEDLNREDVSYIILALNILNVSPLIISNIEKYLIGLIYKKETKQPKVEGDLPKQNLRPVLRPIKSKKEHDEELNTFYLKIKEYFDIDVKLPFRVLTEEEILELIELLYAYGLSKNDIDNCIWKVRKFNENATPIERYKSIRKEALKYMNPKIKDLIEMLDETVDLYSIYYLDSYQEDVRSLLPDLIVEIETAKNTTLDSGIGQLS